MSINKEELKGLYNNFKFGNIKQIDRQRIFPLEKIGQYHVPWTPQINGSKITFGSIATVSLNEPIRFDRSTYTTHKDDVKQTKKPSGRVSPQSNYIKRDPSFQGKQKQQQLPTPQATPPPKPETSATKPALWSSLLKKDEPVVPANQSNNRPKSPIKNTPILETWKVVQTGNKGPLIIPRGLINNGNMCFMNAILQPLIHCPPFYTYITSIRNHNKKDLKVKTPVLDAMVEFAEEFHHGTEKDEEKDCAFEAEFVYDAIRVRTKIDSLKGRQEDAEEFLGFLLDGLHEDLLLTADKPTTLIENGRDEWIEVGKKNKTVTTQSTDINPSQITRIFGGRYRSIVKTTGAKDSITLEPFQSVQLDINHDSINTLEDAILHATKPEVLDDFSHSNLNSTTTKQSYFEAIPPILIISLKRFVYDINIGKTQKLHKHIQIPEILHIPTSIINPSQPASPYRLFSVVNHHGNLAQGGHYTCDVQHQNKNWLRFDDSNVAEVELDLVTRKQKDRQPYMLFYIRDTK